MMIARPKQHFLSYLIIFTYPSCFKKNLFNVYSCFQQSFLSWLYQVSHQFVAPSHLYKAFVNFYFVFFFLNKKNAKIIFNKKKEKKRNKKTLILNSLYDFFYDE